MGRFLEFFNDFHGICEDANVQKNQLLRTNEVKVNMMAYDSAYKEVDQSHITDDVPDGGGQC